MSLLRIRWISALAIGALAASCFAAPAHANDTSCKPVLDAMTNANRKPYHEFATAGDKSFEKIYTTRCICTLGRAGIGG